MCPKTIGPGSTWPWMCPRMVSVGYIRDHWAFNSILPWIHPGTLCLGSVNFLEFWFGNLLLVTHLCLWRRPRRRNKERLTIRTQHAPLDGSDGTGWCWWTPGPSGWTVQTCRRRIQGTPQGRCPVDPRGELVDSCRREVPLCIPESRKGKLLEFCVNSLNSALCYSFTAVVHFLPLFL